MSPPKIKELMPLRSPVALDPAHIVKQSTTLSLELHRHRSGEIWLNAPSEKGSSGTGEKISTDPDDHQVIYRINRRKEGKQTIYDIVDAKTGALAFNLCKQRHTLSWPSDHELLWPDGQPMMAVKSGARNWKAKLTMDVHFENRAASTDPKYNNATKTESSDGSVSNTSLASDASLPSTVHLATGTYSPDYACSFQLDDGQVPMIYQMEFWPRGVKEMFKCMSRAHFTVAPGMDMMAASAIGLIMHERSIEFIEALASTHTPVVI